ncbi:ABC transporter permease [Paenibacillus humicola]|uniref:ABC transporter permease n=1 Tax=Paenibacillus humicola TaxID=3110540 RepID=UPI00237A81C5|nr:ABC transporter permease [Paenibacillus humicola]
MHSGYASLRNEIEKIGRRKSAKGFLLLTLIIPAVAALLLAMLKNNTGMIWGLGSNLPLIMLRLFTAGLIPLFLFMAAADAFPGEVAARTLKLALVRPVSRAKVFASKVLAMGAYIALYLAVLWLSSSISGWLLAGSGMTGSLTDGLKAYAVSFVPMMVTGVMAAFIAQWLNNSSGAVTVAIILYAAAKLLPFVFPAFSVWSVFSYTNWYVLWLGGGAAAGKLLNSFALLLSYGIMAYSAGLLLFERKQL